MSENVQIVITDGVAPTISVKLKAIATDARNADSQIGKLQKSLDGLNGNNLKTITTAQNSAADSANALANAQKNLTAVQSRSEAINQQMAAALNMVNKAAAGVSSSFNQLSAAADKASKSTKQSSQSTKTQADDIAALLGKIDPTVAALGRLDVMEQQLAAHRKNNKIDLETYNQYNAKLQQSRQELTRFTDSTNKAGISTKQYNAAMRGVPAQITDIVVSLQGGQRPLTVLLQQGGQLKDMFGGVGAATRALTTGLIAMVNPFTVLAAVVGAFGFVMYKVESQMREINGLVAQFKGTGRDIDGTFIVELRKELEKLPDVSKSVATEIIKAFADVGNVGGQNLKNASLLVRDLATAMGTDSATAADKLAKALENPLKGVEDLDKSLHSFTVEQMKSIKGFMDHGDVVSAQKVIIDSLKGSIGGLTNEAMTPMQKATTDLGNAWNKFTGELNNSSPIKTATDALVGLIIALTNVINKLGDLASWTPPAWMKGAASGVGLFLNPGGKIMDAFAAYGKSEQASSGSTAITGNNTIQTRTGPQYTQSTEKKLQDSGIKKTPKGKTDHSEENRATALAKVNLQLDNQYKLMQMIGPEADKQQQFDRINEGLVGRKIKLTDTEITQLKEKIALIVDGADKQQEMNRIYELVSAPLRTYNALQQAANELEQKGIITIEERDREMVKAFETYSNILDPMREYNIALDQQFALAKTLGDATEIESKMQELENRLLKEGRALRGDQLDDMRKKLSLLQELNKQQAINNGLIDNSATNRLKNTSRTAKGISDLANDPKSGFSEGDKNEATNTALQSVGIDTTNLKIGADATVSIIDTMYKQIDELLQKSLITEGDAAAARIQVWQKSQETQMNQAQGFFKGLESLSTSSNKNLARIGKAAAISNAIIDTYKSATGAYASMSSIPYVGPALGAAAAAAAIAAGMANVQQIRSQGYQAGGYTGNGATNEVAGLVHGKEFVMNAPATAAHGASNLQALQDGSASIVANSAGASTGSGSGTAGGAAGGSGGASANIKVVNVLDPAMVGDFLDTPQGEQLFLNTIRKNSSAIKQTIQNG